MLNWYILECRVFSFFGVRCFIVPFNLNLVCGCADVELLASGFCRYREHVVWGEKDLRLKLLRKGILTRIYAPMVRTVIGNF